MTNSFLIPAEVFAPVDSFTGPLVCVGALTTVLTTALIWRAIHERAKRLDPTREVSTWEELTQPDWDADRPALIWVSSTLLLSWLTQYGGAAEDDAIVGVDTAIPNATVRYVYADEQVIDVSVSVLVSRDVVPEWSAGPLAWASDADIDGHKAGGGEAEHLRQAEIAQFNDPGGWQWSVPSSTGFTSTPPEETRANLKAAFEPEPDLRAMGDIGRIWPTPTGDPNGEVTAPVEHVERRTALASTAADVDRLLGKPVVHTRAVTYDLEGVGQICSGCRKEWPCADAPTTTGRIVPAQRDGDKS